jgi:ribonucleoside-diphosphate reductase alpha chain
MSFLKIGDRAAGAIKSGGTTRRAAKMVVVDVDHPDIEEFISWKMLEEQKVAALVAGSRLANRHLNAIMDACADGLDPKENPRLRREIVAARRAELPENYIQRVIQFARQGYSHIEFPVFDLDWESEAYASVAGQNANNTVRVTDEFLRAVEADREWALTARTTGVPLKTVSAEGLWERIAEAPGTRPIPACSSIRRSTTGTPAPSPDASTRPTPARSTCSSTTRRAISPR